MLYIAFGGWVSCRLATRPDPFDDPRGNLSGVRQLAFAGEPDLDRVIRFQHPPYQRSHCWPIGVAVTSVRIGPNEVKSHNLVGAAVDLLDSPVFEGRNGVVTYDTREPIHPFHVELRSSGNAVARRFVPKDESYPFPELLPQSGGVNPSEISAATGLEQIELEWAKRLKLLEQDLTTASNDEVPGLEERIELLRQKKFPAFMFRQSMRWSYALNGPVSGDAEFLLGNTAGLSAQWGVDFWFGGYDADAQSFFCSGTLSIPEKTGELIVPMVLRSSRRPITQQTA